MSTFNIYDIVYCVSSLGCLNFLKSLLFSNVVPYHTLCSGAGVSKTKGVSIGGLHKNFYHSITEKLQEKSLEAAKHFYELDSARKTDII